MAPIFQALLHNENEIGFSLHYIDEGIDTGEIIKRQKIKIEKNESVSHIAIRAHIAAGYELLSVINNLKKGDKKTEQITQDNGNYFSWPEKKWCRGLGRRLGWIASQQNLSSMQFGD